MDNYYCRERIIKQCFKQNYLYVNLYKRNKHATLRVHRLVALAFLPNIYNYAEVNHKDENSINNRLDNLEWCSQAYNLHYGTRIARAQVTKKTKVRIRKEAGISKMQEDTSGLPDICSLEGEEWRHVAGYEGLYEISNYGRLKSLHHIIPFIVRTKKIHSGRVNVDLHHNGKYTTFGIHTLVAKAFIPNPENLPEVNHKDENPLNNRADNLEWCTHKYNIRYGTLRDRLSDKLKNNLVTSKAVAQYDLSGKFVRVWPSIREVERCLKTKGWKTICDVCKGRLHSAIGYQWRYVENGTMPTTDIGPCRRRCSTAPKKVYQYTLDRVYVRSYKSVTAAADFVGIPGTNISACIKGKQKSAAGFLWFDKKLNS